MKTDTKPNRTFKKVQRINELHYYCNIQDKDLYFLQSRRKRKSFKVLLPSKKVQDFSRGINHLHARIYRHTVAIEVKDSYKLTKKDINEAYKCNLIVFKYGDTYISGINRDSIAAFKKAFIKKIRKKQSK